ncbi:MAG: acyltransferase family protein, partial [Succinivibrio sp.]
MQKKIRTDINALKAVAILAVVFYHLSDLLKSANLSNSTVIDGGFLGVDIFLFISGYLICKTITDRLYCDSFSLRDFYLRRFFRILPPLIFVCIFTLVAGYFLLVPDVFLELNREIANALLFTGNFRFANSGGYFALDSSDRLLLHTWYLSLTIQFYLICPLLLMVAFKASRKLYPYTVLGIFAGTFVLSAFLSVNSKAYLLTQCRIFELFAGAAIYCFNDRLTSFFKKQSSLIKTACVTVLFAIIIAGFFFTRLQGGIYTPF